MNEWSTLRIETIEGKTENDMTTYVFGVNMDNTWLKQAIYEKPRMSEIIKKQWPLTYTTIGMGLLRPTQDGEISLEEFVDGISKKASQSDSNFSLEKDTIIYQVADLLGPMIIPILQTTAADQLGDT